MASGVFNADVLRLGLDIIISHFYAHLYAIKPKT
jgi:hypothetical protein